MIQVVQVVSRVLTAPISTKLNPAQMKRGLEIGELRSYEIVEGTNGGQDQHGYDGDPYEISIDGAQAELGYNIIMGTKWDESVNTFKTKADAGLDVEIRTTRLLNGCLIWRFDIDNDFYTYTCPKPDKLERKYVLIVKNINEFTIAGWLWGYEIHKLQRFINDPNGRPPAWFIPQRLLNKDLSLL